MCSVPFGMGVNASLSEVGDEERAQDGMGGQACESDEGCNAMQCSVRFSNTPLTTLSPVGARDDDKVASVCLAWCLTGMRARD